MRTTGKSWRRQVTELLAALDPEATTTTTTKGHMRIELSNGARIVTSGTPGDWRSINNLRARVRRELRTNNEGDNSHVD